MLDQEFFNMKVAIVDISRKVPLYDYALCDSLSESLSDNDKMLFIAPPGVPFINKPWEYKLHSLLPSFMQRRQGILRRLLKAAEVYVNYLKLARIVKKESIDVLHMQWLPLLEINTNEYHILKYIKSNSNIKIVLTVHNLFPHNKSVEQKIEYKGRFKLISTFIDHFVVHTEKSKEELCNEFGISEDKVSVIYHGIFKSRVEPKDTSDKIRFIMFGTQSYYKGTDLLIHAYASLSKEDKDKSSCTIIGRADKNFYEDLKHIVEESGVSFNPTFVDEKYLNSEISSSDVIVIPYRAITQSGVLLKAINYQKAILASDLPAFKETLKGFPDELFFKNEDVNDLALYLHRYIIGELSTQDQHTYLLQLQDLYSWEKSATKTIQLYKTLISK